MTRILTKEQFARRSLDFEHTTWKLETRDRYNVSGEREEFEYWLHTGDTSLEEKHARTSTWHRNVRDTRKAGKLWQRVRVVSKPLSDYRGSGLPRRCPLPQTRPT